MVARDVPALLPPRPDMNWKGSPKKRCVSGHQRVSVGSLGVSVGPKGGPVVPKSVNGPLGLAMGS